MNWLVASQCGWSIYRLDAWAGDFWGPWGQWGPKVPCQLDWALMHRGESVSLLNVVYRPVEILSFCLRSPVVVLAEHNLEIINILALDNFSHESLWWLRVYWLPPFPIILGFLVEKTVVSYAVGRSFVNVLDLICVLMGPTSLVEKFLVLRVVMSIVFAVCYSSPVVPWRNLFGPGEVNPRNAKRWGQFRNYLTLLETYSFYSSYKIIN